MIISGHGNIEIAVAAIKQGAYDFIEKPFNIDQLMVVISRAMETSRLRRENVELKRRDDASAEMIGASSAFKALEIKPGQGDQVERSGDADRRRRAAARKSLRAISMRNSNRVLGAVRHGQLRLDRAGTDGRGAVRPRNRRPRCRTGTAGTGPWRGALFRRGGGHAAGHAVQDPAGAGRTAVPARRRRRQGARRYAGYIQHKQRLARRN